jgi:hypothetical protein
LYAWQNKAKMLNLFNACRALPEIGDVAKAHLQSECERLEQETARYVSLTQSALETTTIISDSTHRNLAIELLLRCFNVAFIIVGDL